MTKSILYLLAEGLDEEYERIVGEYDFAKGLCRDFEEAIADHRGLSTASAVTAALREARIG